MDRLVILGIAETATWALCEQQLQAALGSGGSVDAVRTAVEAGVYWPRFVDAVRAGEVDEHHPDLPTGPLRILLPIWASQAAAAEGCDRLLGEGQRS